MDFPEDVADLEVLARRRDFLEFLREPAEKPTIVEDLDHSRSTVDRAVRALEDAGFVERTNDGYVTTLAGKLALDRYDAFLEESAAILEAQPVLDAFPQSLDLPAAALSSAETTAIADTYELFEILAGELRTAEQYRAVLPRIRDSRHVRLVHARVDRHALDATVVSPKTVYQQVTQEFPHIASDLDGAATFSALEADRPNVGVVLTTRGDRATAIVVAYESQEVAGYLRCSADSVVSWAREYVQAAVADATETDALAAGDTPPMLQLDDQRLPAPLRSQGFERIDDAYFDNRTAIDPATAWRAGLQLPEVAAGYAVERFDGDESITETLLDHLGAGEDVAVVGPPGSGKSTVCKQVAYEWFDSQHGPVFVRQGGRGRSFDDLGSLETILERASGHALVVVEDAVRADANAIFDVMQTFRGRDDVSFLLDAREREWHDPEEMPVDARTEAFRRQHVETVEMPALDEREQERTLDRFEQLVDGETLPHEQLLDSTIATDESAGSAFLFFHRLSRYTNLEVEHDQAQLTSLDEHVESVRDALAEAGETALETGILANALNAADIGVDLASLHAVDPGSEEVRAAIDILTGEVLFPDDDPSEGPIRSVHGSWSIRFLERVLDGNSEAAAASQFGRAVTALLSLADDQSRREAVVDALTGSGETIATIAAEPTAWADETTTRVFELGTSYPKLGPLFGSTDESSLTLPGACSETVRLRQRRWRGTMFVYGGRPDRARSEFEAVLDAIPRPTAERSVHETRLHARAHLGLLRVHLHTDIEAAIEHGQRAADAYESIDDHRGAAIAYRSLSYPVADSGDSDAASEHVERAIAHAEAADDKRFRGRCLYSRANHRFTAGETDAALADAREAMEIATDVSAPRQKKEAASLLSYIAREQGRLHEAERYARQVIDLSKRLGDRYQRVAALVSLARCAILRGQFDTAEARLSAARELSEAVPLNGQLTVDVARGRLAAARGAHEEAVSILESAVETAQEHGLARQEVRARSRLGPVLVRRGDLATAREQARVIDRLAGDLDGEYLHGQASRIEGLAALEDGAFDDAHDSFTDAVNRFEAASFRLRAARARLGLGHVARVRGESDRAHDHYDQVREVGRATGAAVLALAAIDGHAELADRPAEWYALGGEIAADAGLDDRAAELHERADAAQKEHEQRPKTD